MTKAELRAEQMRRERLLDHEADQIEERRQQAQRDLDNAATRKRYLDGLEAEKAEKRRLHNIGIDAELEPKKAVLMRQWLADHPGRTPADFNRDAWPYLRANLVAELEAESYSATRDSMIANLGANSI